MNLRKKLVNRYVWCIALYGAENWALWRQIRNTWQVLKGGAGEGRGRSVGPIE
jgi:hypothetical protein